MVRYPKTHLHIYSSPKSLMKFFVSFLGALGDLAVRFKYINDIQDETQWNESFQRTQQKLVVAAQRAKQEIAEGQAKALDYDKL